MNTATKAELLSDHKIKEVCNIMTTLNKYAKEATKGLKVNSCTDVTGFSLIGHSFEMAKGSNKTIEIFSNDVPIIADALNYASMGIIPEGMYNNLEYLNGNFKACENMKQELLDVLLDPQTSGGLLLSMPEKDALEYVSRMEEFTPYCRIIGQSLDLKDKHIIIK